MKFAVNQTYTTRSACDHNCIISVTVKARTDKTVTTSEGKKFRINVWEGIEQIRPWGSYSMCPIVRAA